MEFQVLTAVNVMVEVLLPPLDFHVLMQLGKDGTNNVKKNQIPGEQEVLRSRTERSSKSICKPIQENQSIINAYDCTVMYH